jgi:cytochrome c biogenesis protein CcmG/thiol:disulfide interchange protein DsbE
MMRAPLALIGMVAVAACGGSDVPAPVVNAVAIGQPAPAYAAQQMDGTPIALADLKGEVVLLNVWATWCKPCRQEIPCLLYTSDAADDM